MPVKNYILIASVGRSDIKFILEQQDNNEKQLAEIFSDKGALTLRQVHQALLDNVLPFVFESENIKAARIREKIRFAADPIQARVDEGKIALQDDHGNYLLYAAKLNGLIGFLKQQAQGGKIVIKGGLFVGTSRPAERNEPIASHVLLAQYFARQLSLNYGGELPDKLTLIDCPVYYLNQLKDLDEKNRFYDGKGLDYPVKRIVARRIDNAIARFVNHFSVNTEVILSDTGGMADLKNVLSASVYFRAQGDVLEFPQTEMTDRFDQKTFDQFSRQKHQISRQQSLQVKTRVKQRILEGDFSGAWAACAHLLPENLEKLEQDESWILGVYWVSHYFNGQNSFAQYNKQLDKVSTKNPVKESLSALLQQLKQLTCSEILDQQIQSTLTLTVMKIEAKLQATKQEERDIIGAMRDCSTLSDQLLRASVYHYLNTHHNPGKTTQLKYHNDQIPDNIIGSLKDSLGENEKLKQFIHSPTSKKIIQLRNSKAWRDKLKMRDEYSDYYEFNKRIRAKLDTKKSLTDWRNLSTHQSLTIENISDIIEIACTDKITEYPYPLWHPEFASNHPDKGDSFLNQHYVKEIENKRGYGAGYMKQQYLTLMEQLLDVIQSSIYTGEA